jgi:hypothetical membrane protein
MTSRPYELIAGGCGIVAPVFFALMVVIAGINYPGYSHLTQAISELGGVGAPNPLIQNLNFAVTGLLIIVFASGLNSGLDAGKRSWLGPMLLAGFGVVMVVHAFLPCDAGCEFVTRVGSAHNVTGLAGFLLAITGVFTVSRLEDSGSGSYRGYSAISAAAGLASLVLWIALGRAARIHVMNGSLQRLFAATVLLWIEVTAIRQLMMSRQTSVRGETPAAVA